MTDAVRIEGYVLGACIGRGSTGLVYEAHQESPGRAVALKVLRPGLAGSSGLRRFRREAQVLGWLNHDGIARVYGAGTAQTPEGPVSYLAMELVRGERLDRWAAAHGVDLRGRIELLLQLCDAVHHAHQKGLVHRDLKPANVLVTEAGRVVVLDFGIARLEPSLADAVGTEWTRSGATRAGEVLGTLPYMSPEQVAGDPAAVDTRSDVYSLGVIAYELLAGQLPVDVAALPLPEAARRIREDEPTTLGVLDRRLRGDLEVIVGRALEKQPERRYASVDQLAADLRRHLADEPITARPPSRSYQLAKFARRKRGLVAGAGAAFAALLAGTAASATLFFQASRVLAETTVEAQTAEEVLAFLEDVFAQSDPLVEEISVAEVTRQAAARLRDDFGGRPEVRARLVWVLGRTLGQLELPDEAGPLLEEALELRTALHGDASLEVAEVLQRLARTRMNEQRHDEAVELYQRCLDIRRERLGRGKEVAEALGVLGSALIQVERLDEAEALQTEALAEIEGLLGPDDPLVLEMLHNVGFRLLVQGRLVEAEATFRRLLEVEGGAPKLRIGALLQLGRTLGSQRREREAIPVLREAVALSDEHYPSTELSRSTRTALAGWLAYLGEVDEPVAIVREVYDEVVRRYGEDSPLASYYLHELAYALHDSTEKEEAEATYLAAIERTRATHGPDDPLVFQAQHNLSILYLDLGRLDEAEEYERRSLEGRTRVHGEDHPLTLISLRGLGVVLFRAGRYDEIVELRRDLLERTGRTQGEGSALTQDARLNLANALRVTGGFEEAEALLLEVRDALPGLPDPSETARRMREHLRELYGDWGRPDEAERWAEPAAEAP